MSGERIEVGDHVTISHRTDAVIWDVESIESRIQPLGVILTSGLTNRIRRETYGNLQLHSKGTPA